MLHSSGFSVSKIKTRLSEENVAITQQSLYRLINKFQQTNQYKDVYRRKQEKKITPKMAIIMKEESDEATARQLRGTLMEKYPALRVSLSTVKATHRSIPASILVSIDYSPLFADRLTTDVD